MTSPKIKFCGMMRPQDARLAAELGADFIGVVVHAESRRRVSLDLAREIVGGLPQSVSAVGLFVNAPVTRIRQIADELGLRYVQLHGQESPEVVSALAGLSVFKAIRVEPETLKAELERWKGVKNLAALLLDSGSGGEGIENNWEAIEQASRMVAGLPPIILAGGLRPETVGAVVSRLHPWAVDVSTGVEVSVGVKSREKMVDFVQAVRG